MLRSYSQYIITTLLAILVLVVCSTSTSPLYVDNSLDSNIFQQIGLGILSGKIPYTDLFDHKGPVLFYLDAVGLGINTFWGILLLQILSLSFTLSICFKILQLYKVDSPKQLGGCYLGIFLFLAAFLSGGNLSEEWSLPFLVLPIYWCQKSIHTLKYDLTFSQLLLTGLCIGTVCFIRANNVFPILGYLFFLFGVNLQKKHYGLIARSMGWIGVGILCVALFWTVVFYGLDGMNGVNNLFYGTIGFNLEYVNVYTFDLSPLFILKSYAPWVAFMVLALLGVRKYPELVLPLVISYLFTILTIGNTLYRHYFLIFLPLLPATFAVIWKLKQKRVLILLMVCILGACNLSPIQGKVKTILQEEQKEIADRQKEFREMMTKLEPEAKDSIWNFNCRNELDLLNSAGIVQCNRVLVPAHLEISERFYVEEKGKLKLASPPYIIIDKDFSIPDMEEWSYIFEHYSPVDSTHSAHLSNLWLLKRNQ